MRRAGRRTHRISAWIAAVLTLVALVGVFLPWWSVPTRADGADRDGELVRIMIRLGTGGKPSIAGYHGEGVWIVVALFLGLGCVLASVVLKPWSASPAPPLFVGLFLITTAAIVTILPQIDQWQIPDPRRRLIRMEYGWWVTAVATVLAALATFIALRRAATQSHAEQQSVESFD